MSSYTHPGSCNHRYHRYRRSSFILRGKKQLLLCSSSVPSGHRPLAGGFGGRRECSFHYHDKRAVRASHLVLALFCSVPVIMTIRYSGIDYFVSAPFTPGGAILLLSHTYYVTLFSAVTPTIVAANGLGRQIYAQHRRQRARQSKS
jgi:hypothetical protein